MPYRDMRDYLAVLEQRGKLKRVTQEVDRMWEPAALAKWMFQALPDAQRFGLRFDKVAGSTMPLVTGALGASTETFALALGVEPEAINDTVVAAPRARRWCGSAMRRGSAICRSRSGRRARMSARTSPPSW
jgi:UbiD family decarboxylase